MAEGVNFSGKLSKKINLDEISVENMTDAKKKDVASLFNTQNTGADENILTTDELVVLNDIDANHNGQITEDEIGKYYDDNYANNSQTNPKGVQKADYIAYVKALAKQNETKTADKAQVGNTYTIQLGENLNDIVARVLKANGNTNPSSEDIEECKQQIIELNKSNGSIKFDGSGNVRWLVGGQQLILPVDTTTSRAKKYIKDQDNKAQVDSKYAAWKDGRGPLKSFTYKIDDDGKTYEVRGGQQTEFDTQKMYDATTGSYENSYQTPVIDESKITETDETKKEKIKERLNDGSAVLKSFAEHKADVSVEKGTQSINGTEYNKKTIKYDGKEIIVFYDKTSGAVKEIWIDADGRTDDNGHKYEISIKADGSTAVYRENNDPSTRSVTEAGTFDMNAVKTLVKAFAGETFDEEPQADADPAQIAYSIDDYETQGQELGIALYNQVDGWSSDSGTRELLEQISEKNVYHVVKAFNEKSPKENVIKYLVNESGITYGDLTKVLSKALQCAEDHGLKETDEYNDLKTFIDECDSKSAEDPSNEDWAERVDAALKALLDKVKVNAKPTESKEGDVIADYKIRSSKVDGENVGAELYDQLDGWSSNDNTRTVLDKITKKNVYYVIQQFSAKSPNEHVIKYMVNESGITYGDLTKVINNVLDCAKDFGLEDTTEYRKVKVYKDECDSKTDQDPDDEDWAGRLDSAIEVLLSKVKTVANAHGDNI